MKTNLFSRFRNLFRRSEETYEDSYEEGYEDFSEVIDDESSAGDNGCFGDAGEQGPAGDVLRMPPGAAAPGRESRTGGVHVPLAPIAAGLPIELQSRLLHDVGDLSVFLSLEQILPQLSKGLVSLPFGELRRVAPRVFAGNQDQDQVLVNVPLSAILPHINPGMLARRHGPLQMEIPEDIVSPFADRGAGLSITPANMTASAPAAPVASPQPQPPVEPPSATPVSPSVRKPVPQPLSRPLVRPAPTSPAPSAPAARSSSPLPKSVLTPLNQPSAQPALPNKPVSAIGSDLAGTGPAPRRPSAVPSFTSKGTSILGKTSLEKATPPAPNLPSPSVPTATAESRPPLQLALNTVADGWPDGLKQEIIHLDLVQARLSIPFGIVEGGLKRGKLSFTWKQIKTWLTPPAAPGLSVHDNAEIEFPLRVVAPLFIAQQKEKVRETAKVAVDKDIPNLFAGLPQPDTAGVAVDHSVSRPLDTNYYIWDDRDDMVAAEARASAASRAATAGTEFVTRYATPNEVVSRAASLEGVVGAVIALPDGLMVANQLPPGLNGDTLAAFLPQLFSKVTQCTQELRMGELNNLNFTVGNVPWKIFRVNALYFAAFGTKGEPLPTARLAALAGELDHKAKV